MARRTYIFYVINLLAPDFFFNFGTPVYKMWIIQEPNTLELWNKLHFEEKKKKSIYHVQNIQYLYLLNRYIKCNFRVSGAVRPLEWSLGVKGLSYHVQGQDKKDTVYEERDLSWLTIRRHNNFAETASCGNLQQGNEISITTRANRSHVNITSSMVTDGHIWQCGTVTLSVEQR